MLVAHARPAAYIDVTNDATLGEDQERTTGRREQEEKKSRRFITFGQFEAKDYEFILDELLLKNEFTAIVGEEGIGKGRLTTPPTGPSRPKPHVILSVAFTYHQGQIRVFSPGPIRSVLLPSAEELAAVDHYGSIAGAVE